jgi:hypothetical protein
LAAQQPKELLGSFAPTKRALWRKARLRRRRRILQLPALALLLLGLPILLPNSELINLLRCNAVLLARRPRIWVRQAQALAKRQASVPPSNCALIKLRALRNLA